MHRRLFIMFFAASLAASAQVRDTVHFSSTPSAPTRTFSVGAPAAAQQHQSADTTTTAPVDRFDFKVQERNLRVFNNGGTAGIRIHNRRGNFVMRGNNVSPCYSGYCGGYFYNPYLAMPVYVESNNGPDFSAQPSAYTVYGPDAPAEYMAPGAAAIESAYRQGHMDAQLEQRITSLADEVARLRAEKEVREAAARDVKRTAASPDRSFGEATLDAHDPARGPVNAATATVVFKNGTKLDIANYAVVGRTLWVFDEQRARKILLADLDLDATHRANAASGYELRIPVK